MNRALRAMFRVVLTAYPRESVMKLHLAALLAVASGITGCATTPPHQVFPAGFVDLTGLGKPGAAPDNCLPPEVATCTLDNRCPIDPKRPLKCYGPIVSGFYCCWDDPY
jgi:hypothetical protein